MKDFAENMARSISDDHGMEELLSMVNRLKQTATMTKKVIEELNKVSDTYIRCDIH